MEQLPGCGTRFRRYHRCHPSAERYMGTLQPPPKPSAASPPLELSEEDIFSTHMECLPTSPARPIFDTNPKPAPNIGLNGYGILAALNSNLIRSGSGSYTQPIFNHKASPATSEVAIPRPPPIQGERTLFVPRSAPVNIPVIPEALRRRTMELEEAIFEGEKEDLNGMILPPHEVAAFCNSPVLACSMMEGTGRTLKGRDLRQVRHAIFRRTGFID